jgi:hypothetical protein
MKLLRLQKNVHFGRDRYKRRNSWTLLQIEEDQATLMLDHYITRFTTVLEQVENCTATREQHTFIIQFELPVLK